MVGRAAFVFPLSFLSNLSKKEARPKISFKQQVIIWWAGLMRGAVSIALAYNKFTASGHTEVRVNAIMITSTVIVVLFSTMVFGLLTKPLLTLLIPPRTGPNTSSLLSSQSILDPLLTSMMGSDFDVGQISSPRYNLQFILTAPTRSVHRLWRKFDDRFMRPMFGGRGLFHLCLDRQWNEATLILTWALWLRQSVKLRSRRHDNFLYMFRQIPLYFVLTIIWCRLLYYL